MARRSDLPSEVAERVRRHRARLDRSAVRIDAHGGPLDQQFESIDESTSGVLVVDALPRRERALRESLDRLRSQLRPGVEVRIVQRSRLLERSRIGRLADRASSTRFVSDHLCDVPAAIRASGFTIGSIERVELRPEDGPRELWVDVVAIDLSAAD